jgi:hypothetical protein
MTNANIIVAGGEVRKSLLRVWMAISATWVAFWLLIAATVFVTATIRDPFVEQLPTFALIVLLPPLALLGVGTVTRLLVESCRPRSRA